MVVGFCERMMRFRDLPCLEDSKRGPVALLVSKSKYGVKEEQRGDIVFGI